MSNALALRAEPGGEPLPKKAYTMALLQRGMEKNSIPQARLQALHLALHRAAAERASQYTRGRSMTVTREQAEAFYVSVLHQLDAALLSYGSDAAAEEALCTEDADALLAKGQTRILQCYEEAKERFRRAYQLTKPFATYFFRELLKSFAQFTTEYDARFRSDAVKVDEVYPLMAERRSELPGVLGVHAYYSALLLEGELLAMFQKAQIHALMKQYAKRYLTSWDMIAESIADLVLRQWLCRALLIDSAPELELPADAAAVLTERYQQVPPGQIEDEMRRAIAESVIAENAGVCAYCTDAVPYFAETLHRRVTENNLRGWICCAASPGE